MAPPSDRKDEDAPSKGTARLDRRDFVRVAGLGAAGLAGAVSAASAASESPDPRAAAILADPEWPSLRHYPQDRIARIALPLGGIGTGTVSLGGRGDLCDWEIMNRPAKGFVPTGGGASPFFALFARAADDAPVCRILEGPIESFEFEGSHGSPAPNAGLPRFRECCFSSAYPFGRVMLRDPGLDRLPLLRGHRDAHPRPPRRPLFLVERARVGRLHPRRRRAGPGAVTPTPGGQAGRVPGAGDRLRSGGPRRSAEATRGTRRSLDSRGYSGQLLWSGGRSPTRRHRRPAAFAV